MRRIAPLLVALMLSASAESQPLPASWLDSPALGSWNSVGASLPSAPAGPRNNPDPRCRALARSAAGDEDEDRELQAHGWDLIGQPTGKGRVRVLGGAADYDGMCRPLRYQYFVFSGHSFVGTLSPDLMDSRTDGALNHVMIGDDGTITARYARYAATDPLCCPSQTTTVVFSLGESPPSVRPLSAKTAANLTSAAPK